MNMMERNMIWRLKPGKVWLGIGFEDLGLEAEKNRCDLKSGVFNMNHETTWFCLESKVLNLVVIGWVWRLKS